MEVEEQIETDPLDIFDTAKWLPNCNKLSCAICDEKFSNKVNRSDSNGRKFHNFNALKRFS